MAPKRKVAFRGRWAGATLLELTLVNLTVGWGKIWVYKGPEATSLSPCDHSLFANPYGQRESGSVYGDDGALIGQTPGSATVAASFLFLGAPIWAAVGWDLLQMCSGSNLVREQSNWDKKVCSESLNNCKKELKKRCVLALERREKHFKGWGHPKTMK